MQTRDVQDAQDNTTPSNSVPTTSGRDDDRETSVPQENFESVPVQVDPQQHRVTPGQVVAAEGYVVRPALPNVPTATRMASTPMRNPIVRVEFDRTGRVRHATLHVTTGRAEWDTPILESLYRYHAQGERIEVLGNEQRLRVEIKLLLVPE